MAKNIKHKAFAHGRSYGALLLMSAVLIAGIDKASAQENKNEISLGFGESLSRAAPRYGGLLSASYARVLTPMLAVLFRPELDVNLTAPDGNLMKGAAFGADVGVRWQLGLRDRVHLALYGALGGRGYFEPGYGVCIRVATDLYLPLGSSLDFTVEMAGEAGVARLGDENPQTVFQARGDVLAGMSYRF